MDLVLKRSGLVSPKEAGQTRRQLRLRQRRGPECDSARSWDLFSLVERGVATVAEQIRQKAVHAGHAACQLYSSGSLENTLCEAGSFFR